MPDEKQDAYNTMLELLDEKAKSPCCPDCGVLYVTERVPAWRSTSGQEYYQSFCPSCSRLPGGHRPIKEKGL